MYIVCKLIPLSCRILFVFLKRSFSFATTLLGQLSLKLSFFRLRYFHFITHLIAIIGSRLLPLLYHIIWLFLQRSFISARTLIVQLSIKFRFITCLVTIIVRVKFKQWNVSSRLLRILNYTIVKRSRNTGISRGSFTYSRRRRRSFTSSRGRISDSFTYRCCWSFTRCGSRILTRSICLRRRVRCIRRRCCWNWTLTSRMIFIRLYLLASASKRYIPDDIYDFIYVITLFIGHINSREAPNIRVGNR